MSGKVQVQNHAYNPWLITNNYFYGGESSTALCLSFWAWDVPWPLYLGGHGCSWKATTTHTPNLPNLASLKVPYCVKLWRHKGSWTQIIGSENIGNWLRILGYQLHNILWSSIERIFQPRPISLSRLNRRGYPIIPV